MIGETVRLALPQWQGGMNPAYMMGARILSAIVPESPTTPTVTVPLSGLADAMPTDSVDQQGALLDQMTRTYDILAELGPRRVITLGGDCSVSEAPFDYLHTIYPEHFGVIWLDAHPDISTPESSRHIHEMVVANLMCRGAKEFNEIIHTPLTADELLYAGLKVDELRPMDHLATDLPIEVIRPEKLDVDDKPVEQWLARKHIKHVAVHWDLDVLDPDDFRSILPAQPYLDRSGFGAAIGSLKLSQVFRLLSTLSRESDLVGLSIAEHMPWDAINLNKGLSLLPIFN